MKKRIITIHSPEYVKLLRAFNIHMSTLGYSRSGSETKYGNTLEFLTWLEQNKIRDIRAVRVVDIKQYCEYLKYRPHKKKEGVLSLSTIQHHVQSIRQFFMMLQERGDIIKNPMSVIQFTNKKAEKRQRIILTVGEVKELYRHTETLQERAILGLAYGCGLRSMEVVAVNTDDIKADEGILIVQRGKGNKRRVIPLSHQVRKDLENYQQCERPLYTRSADEKAFLLNIKGVRLRKYTCRDILKKIIERTGNGEIISKNIAIHNLRHSIATHLLEQGVPIEHVQNFLGHSHLETTEVYTRVNQKQLKALMN